MDRALLVGINTYPSAPLLGCVNDIEDMADFLVAKCAFKEGDIRLLADARATTSAILERLQWLTSGLSAGDRVLFQYSGHGAQVPTRNPAGEVDGQDEVICPVDFDWSDTRLIRDKQFHQIFSAVPKGVKFIWVSDSCHSGDLTRGMPANKIIQRRYPVPADMRWRQIVARQASIVPFGFSRAATQLHIALISGCQSSQTSADANFDGKPNGALTYFLLKQLSSVNGLRHPLRKIVPAVVRALKNAHYDQVPQLEGSRELMSRPFLV